jgi:hypothetical protein
MRLGSNKTANVGMMHSTDILAGATLRDAVISEMIIGASNLFLLVNFDQSQKINNSRDYPINDPRRALTSSSAGPQSLLTIDR